MRRVRLTEGQLHNVIRESVNNILNEITKDLKKKCMDKSYDLGRYSQGDNFADSLSNDLNNQYGYSNKRGEQYFEPSNTGRIKMRNRTYMDSNRKNSDWYVDKDDYLYGNSETKSFEKYSPAYQNMFRRYPDYKVDAQLTSASRDNIPSYRTGKQELDRLSNITYE